MDWRAKARFRVASRVKAHHLQGVRFVAAAVEALGVVCYVEDPDAIPRKRMDFDLLKLSSELTAGVRADLNHQQLNATARWQFPQPTLAVAHSVRFRKQPSGTAER